MRTLLLLLLFAPSMLLAHGRKHKPWWPVNADGTMKYIYIGKLQENRYLVIDHQDHYGFIDSALNDRIPCIYDSATPFINNKSLVRKNGKYGIVDTAGNELVPIQFDSIGAAKLSDRYFDILKIIDSIALVKENRQIGLYNMNNQSIKWIDYDVFYESHWDRFNIRVASKDGKLALMRADGEVLTPFIYKYLARGPLQMRIAKRDGYYGFLDSNFREVIPCKYQRVDNYEQGFAAVKDSMCWGFIDTAGHPLTPFIYDEVNDFNDGIAAVKLNNKWGFIDTLGRLAIDIRYDTVYDFKNGLAEVRYKSKWCRINKAGHCTTAWYDTFIERNNDYWHYKYTVVKQNGKYGTIDSAGDPAVPCVYDSINCWRYRDESYYNGLLPFMNKSGKIALVDTLGRQHTAFRYNKIEPVYQDNDKYGYYRVSTGEKKGLIGSGDGDTTGLIFDEMDFYCRDKPYLPVRINSSWGLLGFRPIRYLAPVTFEDEYQAINSYKRAERLSKAKAAGLQGYTEVLEFYRGLAVVRNAAGQYGYINGRGAEVIPCSFTDAWSFQKKWAAVDSGNMHSLINRKGKVLFPWRKEIMVWYGRFGVFRHKDHEGFFDKAGSIIFPCKLRANQRISRNMFAACNGGCGMITSRGNIKVPFDYEMPPDVHRYVPLFKNGRWHIFSPRGRHISTVDSSLQVASIYNNGRISVKDTNDKYGYINKHGKLVIPCIYSSADLFYNRGAVVELKDTLHPDADATGIINKRGKVLIPFKFRSISTWARHKSMMVRASKYEGYGYVDRKGNLTSPFVYSKWIISYTTTAHEPKQHFKREGNEWVYRNYRGKIKLRLPAADEPKLD